MYARCPVRAVAALMFRPQLISYVVIIKYIIWLPAIYICAREYETVNCHPSSLLHIPPPRCHRLVSHALALVTYVRCIEFIYTKLPCKLKR